MPNEGNFQKEIDHRHGLLGPGEKAGFLYQANGGMRFAFPPYELLRSASAAGAWLWLWGDLLAAPLDQWQRAGVWERLHVELLSRLRAAGEIEWSRAVVDSSQIRAKKGAPERARAGSTEAVQGRSTISSSMPAGYLLPGA